MKTKLKISNGNSKIGKDTLILNITSATDCPSKKLGLCKHADKCYAMKAERQYKQVLPFRREQTMQWDRGVYNIYDEIIKMPKVIKGNIKYLRFSESGDFRSQEDINNMSLLAEWLKERNIYIYGYTARKDLDFSNVSDNMTVNGSGFMLHNEFKAVYEYSNNALQCLGDCKICNRCKYRTGKTIEVKYH